MSAPATFLPTSESESRAGYPGWRVAIACCLAVMAGFGSVLIYTFGMFVKPLSTEFGWSRQTISTGFACASLTLGFCSPLLGHWIDRYGARRVILACVAIFGTAFASLAFLTPNLAQFFGAFVVLGAVGNGTAQMGYARVIATWFARRRGLALAIMMAGSGFGAIFIPIVCQRLIETFGWRTAYASLGLGSLAVGVPMVALFVRENPASRETRGRVSASAGATVRDAARSRAFWFLLATLFLAAMSTTGTVTHLAALLTDAGVTAAGASYAVAVLGFSSLCGRLVTGWLLDRFFAGRVGMVLLLMTTAGLVVLNQARSEFAGICAAVLLGFSMGGEMDITPYMLSRYFGLRSLSTLYGFSWTAYAISAAAGSILLGRAFDTTGSYGLLLLQLAGLTFSAAVLMALMPRYPGEQ